jgi:hypothetical protein
MATATATMVEYEFVPGSVTDTCGVCFERFDLQYPADQYSTVRNWGTDTFDLVCPCCEDKIAETEATACHQGEPMTITRDADGNVTLGVVHDHEGRARTVFRDFDEFVAPSMTLRPAGVTELEARIVDYRNALARYRLRELDFDSLGIDLDEARDNLYFFYPGIADSDEPGNLELADWVEVGQRLAVDTHYTKDTELRKLHALLMADETPATEADHA